MAKWMFLAAGIYLIGYGLTARSLISESDMPATKEERRNAKPTLLKRAVVTGAGLAAFIYSIIRFIH
jgi:hypothetical protein